MSFLGIIPHISADTSIDKKKTDNSKLVNKIENNLKNVNNERIRSENYGEFIPLFNFNKFNFEMNSQRYVVSCINKFFNPVKEKIVEHH